MNSLIKKIKSYKIKSKLRSKDSRGSILSICDFQNKNVSIIYCKKNSIRSNHYHKKDYHLMYVLNGEVDYFYKSLKSKKIKYLKIKQNESVFTPPKEIHATFFPKNTTLIVCSKNHRDKLTYERDTVRVEIINKKNIHFFRKKNER